MAAWIPSPNFYPGRRRPLAFIVWHATESPERAGGARAVAANWFAKVSSQVSAHVVVDAAEVVECVKPGDTAWHCANGNADGYGIEIVGYTGQGAGWRDTYSLAAIRNACAWIRSQPVLAALPARWLTDDQLGRHERGLTTHAQVSRVLGGTNHTDPGPDFPTDYVLAQLGQSPGPPSPPPIGTYCQAGDRSDRVLRLQQFMTRVFPTYNSYRPTGYYGMATTEGMAEFQRRAGVTGPDANGTIVGPRTLKALVSFGFDP